MIHAVGVDLNELSYGRITLDGKPLSCVDLRIVAEVGKPPLVTFTVRATVEAITKAETIGYRQFLRAGEHIEAGDVVTVAHDGTVHRWQG